MNLPTINTPTAALLAGLVTSLHCAGMCGPLACVLMPVRGDRADAHTVSTVYHLTRLTSYTMLGALVGGLGRLPLSLLSQPVLRWLPWLMLPVGVEMGFSSAGAGAIGSLALQNLTRLSLPEVAGTNILFGLVLALVGGGIQIRAGSYDSAVLGQLLAGGVCGGLVGAYVANWLPSKPLRVGLCLWLASLGGVLCWRAI